MPPRKTILLAAAALLALLAGYNAVFKWPALKQSVAKHEKLIAAIENRQWGRVGRLTSEHYRDSLELDREKLLLALKDVGFLTGSDFRLNWQQSDVQRDGDAVAITGSLRISGGIGPGAAQVESYSRPFAGKPFTFRWRKTGTLPWSWQLESADHPDAELPAGYVPGSVRSRFTSGGF